MTAVTYLTRHRRPGIVILCSIVAVLSMLFVLPPAIASAADSGAQAVDECNPTASNGCVNGILQDADKKPIADVTITLSGKATAETKTAADGKWAFSVVDDGDYTVTIDASVAKEHGLKASSATVTIKKASFDKQRGVVRFDQAGDSAGSGGAGSGGHGDGSGGDAELFLHCFDEVCKLKYGQGFYQIKDLLCLFISHCCFTSDFVLS